ncbi:MAG: Threonine synthase [Candidatus Falkowbacteria bacterium GW2011_GWC2_38_22]|uniref:Threonine synthase n=1 Tax=Candidatus Falkowbacteria bacterium GW2011_GWE1_38_31 TaxID=1618638 RepID=A0A0G0K2P9_9BACT|nr:MAG: Threonine synthase [Candidatus Falkowbacteria bacterium GW2011_GWF2_38_1205]KKQ60777.1 MAG: Threonine synthase [Candidatus Falkowbacteria bacterium GW2011_GWC2_38_22]KKQ62944.1 MAG: Threonine synthase [Candidatus Falkowbacteria bacterium GW2011_GWF1_38_22]KKQ64956.1 MAG: Threonine synthase [Candidatus Falkowbacteria bacterium GW2011_GWE2_38_254]KKQ69720.1 MAG: Threonine synthase [Candidatus Falkowbacteria bacterium GW2011_GWE1_38_31]KKQ72328.1 MAG: Threonine synthase [Candidatus Falkow
MTKINDFNGTRLRCIRCGYETSLLKERDFQCECGGLYDVVHELEPNSFEHLTGVFDERAMMSYRASNDPKITSGVWRFKELIMPGLDDSEIVTLGEGNYPIVPFGKNLKEWIGGDLDGWLVLEGVGPTNSFKDNGGTVLISVAKKTGVKLIGAPSTGDTSAMVAAYASIAGMVCCVVLPDGQITPVQITQPLVHGSKVILLPANFDICKDNFFAIAKTGLIDFASSKNPTRIEGHQSTVFRIAQHFGWALPDAIVFPVGNGSNGSSIGKAQRTLQAIGYKGRISRLVGAQSHAACPLAKSFLTFEYASEYPTIKEWEEQYNPMEVGETAATAARIGDPVSYLKILREIIFSDGCMDFANEEDLMEAVAICGKDGRFICPQSGTALAVLKKRVEKGTIAPGSRVCVICTADGIKFCDAAVKSLLPTVVKAKDASVETLEALMKKLLT